MSEPVTFQITTGEVTGLGPVQLIAFEITVGAVSPAQFAEAIAKQRPRLSPAGCGVILSGRGPVWGYAMLLHEAHPTRWVATEDPRLGAVIVQSHTPGVEVGTVIPPEAVASLRRA